MNHADLVLMYRLKTVQAPLYFRSDPGSSGTHCRARDVAHYAAGDDLDRVWAARNDEQDARNRSRREAWRARHNTIREYAI